MEEATTGQRAAEAFIAAHQELVDFVRGCDDTDWRRPVPIEERSVAVIADHIATGYELLVGWIERALAGAPIVGTREEQDADNAHHAASRAGVSREEVLALLEKRAPRVAAVLASVPEEVAEGNVEFGPAAGPVNVAQLMSMSALHVTRHLAHVREAIAAPH